MCVGITNETEFEIGIPDRGECIANILCCRMRKFPLHLVGEIDAPGAACRFSQVKSSAFQIARYHSRVRADGRLELDSNSGAPDGVAKRIPSALVSKKSSGCRTSPIKAVKDDPAVFGVCKKMNFLE